jgi:YjbE family integral membrane protein
MTLDSLFRALNLIFQVSLLDLILSGDNAVVIALSCRRLPPRQMKQAMLLGSGAAIGLRVLLTMMVSMLLQVAMLKLIGAVLLIVIAIRLLIEEERAAQSSADAAPASLGSAVMTVLVADLVMSLDNVVALAAVTQGSVLYLVLGLLVSVALLMISSSLMINLLRRYPLLIPGAGALLGYIAGSIAVSDPAVAVWVNTQSPALTGLVPLLCAVFVVAESRIIARRRRQLPRPAGPVAAPKLAPAARRAESVMPAPAEPAMAAQVPRSTGFAMQDAPATAEPAASAEAVAPAATGTPVDPAIPEPAAAGAADSAAARPAPQSRRDDAGRANRFGLGKLLGNTFVQATASVLLAIFCLLFLPKALDIVILVAIVALMLFKIF